MAHKSLISGVGYNQIGGRCLINGVGYDMIKGRTLAGGVGYDVAFEAEIYTVTLATHADSYSGKVRYKYCRVTINGVDYPPSSASIGAEVNETLQLEAGTVIACTVRTTSFRSEPAGVYLNGVEKTTLQANQTDVTYEYTVTCNATITLKDKLRTSAYQSGNIYIVEE